MKFSILATAAVLSILAISNAHASILSASSQAVREPSTETAGHWNAATLQQNLNASLRDAADATAPSGSLSLNRPSIVGGGLLVNTGESGAMFTPFTETGSSSDLFEMRAEPIGISTGWSSNGPSSPVVVTGGYETYGRRDRNPYATPEPSTWMLLATGLLVLGAYAGLRRRQASTV
jgi:PEP-CTERM motif